jgi:hypothetical protein
MQMPQDWQPGAKAVFAYKSKERVFVLRVHEIPNGHIEASIEVVGPGDEKHTTLVKMIERCGTFDNLDSWLNDDETIKKYKKEVLSKIIDLPPEEVKP